MNDNVIRVKLDDEESQDSINRLIEIRTEISFYETKRRRDKA